MSEICCPADSCSLCQLSDRKTSKPIFTHRFYQCAQLSTIRDADMILYMENGDIKEARDHDELMKQNGKYAVLYNSQFS